MKKLLHATAWIALGGALATTGHWLLSQPSPWITAHWCESDTHKFSRECDAYWMTQVDDSGMGDD